MLQDGKTRGIKLVQHWWVLVKREELPWVAMGGLIGSPSGTSWPWELRERRPLPEALSCCLHTGRAVVSELGPWLKTWRVIIILIRKTIINTAVMYYILTRYLYFVWIIILNPHSNPDTTDAKTKAWTRWVTCPSPCPGPGGSQAGGSHRPAAAQMLCSPVPASRPVSCHPLLNTHCSLD